MSDDTGSPTSDLNSGADDIGRRITGIRSRRGYVLPSHRVLAGLIPEVLDAYEVIYAAISSKPRVLTPLERNFVWILVIGCSEVPIGAHHIRDFIQAGGGTAEIEDASVLATLACGSRMAAIVEPGWKASVPDLDLRAAYQRAVLASSPPSMPVGLVHAGLAAGQACRRAWDFVELHIVRAKEAGLSDSALAEALTLVVLPSGNPAFVQACSVWLDLIREGRVEASPALEQAMTAI